MIKYVNEPCVFCGEKFKKYPRPEGYPKTNWRLHWQCKQKIQEKNPRYGRFKTEFFWRKVNLVEVRQSLAGSDRPLYVYA